MLVPKTLHLTFANRDELREALLWDVHPPGLVLPDRDSLVVGDRVTVRVDVQECGSVALGGLVIWRRVMGGPGGRSGVGIRFGPGEKDWIALVDSAAPAPRARSLPIAFVVQDEPHLREGVLTDIGRRRARLSAPSPPAADLVVALRLRPPRTSPVVAARVLRTAGQDAWIEVLSESPAVLRFWEGLVVAESSGALG